MVQLSTCRSFDVPAADMWKRIGDYGAIHTWHPFITATTRAEDARVRNVTFIDGTVLVETLLHEGDYFYTYRVENPGPLYESLVGTLQVREAGPEACEAIWEAEMELSGINDRKAQDIPRLIQQAGLESL